MADDIVERLRAYDGRVWETTACYNGLREEAADALEQERGDARTLRGFIATYKMTPSMMASRAEIAEARVHKLKKQLTNQRTISKYNREQAEKAERAFAEAYERAAQVCDAEAAHYQKIISEGKGEHGKAGYVRDDTWASWAGRESQSVYLATVIRKLAQEVKHEAE